MIVRFNKFLNEKLDDEKLDKGTKKLVDEISTLSYNEIKEILEYGVDDINYDNGYIIRIACDDCDLETIKLLIENGANVRVDNDITLKRACRDGSVELVKLLLDNGCNPNSVPFDRYYSKNIFGENIIKILKEYSEKHKNLVERIRKIKNKYDKTV